MVKLGVYLVICQVQCLEDNHLFVRQFSSSIFLV